MMKDRIRALREDRDLTQSQIARVLGTTQQQYSKIENGVEKLIRKNGPRGFKVKRLV